MACSAAATDDFLYGDYRLRFNAVIGIGTEQEGMSMNGRRTRSLRCLGLAGCTLTWMWAAPVLAQDLVVRDYPGFSLEVDCEVRGPVIAHYRIGPDLGNEERKNNFHPDTGLPPDCRQTSTETYDAPADAPFSYDRGHLVPANHMDNDRESIAASDVMTNIVPQASVLNRRGGAWRKTEDLIECWREDGSHAVWIGVLWGCNEANDYFVESHGIATPDEFVKLVYSEEERKAIAWRLPNRPIRAGELSDWIVAPEAVEAVIGRELDLPGVDKTKRARSDDWPERRPCDIK